MHISDGKCTKPRCTGIPTETRIWPLCIHQRICSIRVSTVKWLQMERVQLLSWGRTRSTPPLPPTTTSARTRPQLVAMWGWLFFLNLFAHVFVFKGNLSWRCEIALFFLPLSLYIVSFQKLINAQTCAVLYKISIYLYFRRKKTIESYFLRQPCPRIPSLLPQLWMTRPLPQPEEGKWTLWRGSTDSSNLSFSLWYAFFFANFNFIFLLS